MYNFAFIHIEPSVSLDNVVILVGLLVALISNLQNRKKLTNIHDEVKNGTDNRDEDHITIRDLLTTLIRMEGYSHTRNHDIINALTPGNAHLSNQLEQEHSELVAIREALERISPVPPAAQPRTPPT